jgi:uncharacterized protein
MPPDEQASFGSSESQTSMLVDVILSASPVILILLILSLIVAGAIKGIIGVGMPTIAIPLVTMFIDVKAAVMLLSMPLILSNIPQAVEGGRTYICFLRLVPVFLGMTPGILVGVWILLKLDPSAAKATAGAVVVFIAVISTFAPQIEIKANRTTLVGATAGFFGGALGGLAAMPGPFVFTYLIAKGLRGKEFTKEASLFLVVSATMLAMFLSNSPTFDWRDLMVSAIALIPVAVGMIFGRQLRDRIPAAAFRRIVLAVVGCAGIGLMVSASY